MTAAAPAPPLDPTTAEHRARPPVPGRRPADAFEQPALGVDDARAAFRPEGAWEDWFAGMVALTATRAGRCPAVERALRNRAMSRAAGCWEEDRKVAAEGLAAGLGRNPSRVVARLRATPAGIDWLIGRWRQLARIEAGRWEEEHRTLAARLLGGDEAVDPTSPEFIDAQTTELEALRGRAAESDAGDRELAVAGLLDAAVPDLARLRSHERALHRRLAWCLDQLAAGRARAAERRWTPDRATPPAGTAVSGPTGAEPSGRIEAQKTNPTAVDAARPSATVPRTSKPFHLVLPPMLTAGEVHDLLVAEGLDGPVDLIEHRRRRVDPARAARRARDDRRRSRAGGG